MRARSLLVSLLTTCLLPGQEASPTFRAGVALVRVDVQVSEGARLVTDLTQEDFVLYDENRPQPITHFGRVSDPLSLLLVLDVSGSMQRHIQQMAATAKAALESLEPADRVAILLFSRKAEIREDFTTDRALITHGLREATREQNLGAGTAINPALLAAAEYLQKDPDSATTGRRAALILTDNLGLNYQAPDEDVIRAFLQAQAVANAIVVGKGTHPAKPKRGLETNPDFTPADVFHIATATGGEAVQVNQVGNSLASLLERVRTRYQLQFRAAPDAANQYHHLRVALSPGAKSVILMPRSGLVKAIFPASWGWRVKDYASVLSVGI